MYSQTRIIRRLKKGGADHLLKWIFSFSQAVIRNANTEFYQGMANLLQGYLTLDLRALNELLDIKTTNS
jgi:putative dimethyl sulfoxide reductase chaperone